SCLSAELRWAPGGSPQTCQQQVCIADNIDVQGTKTSIRQVCPDKCPKLFQCVCYIHADVNQQITDTNTCHQTNYVDSNGTITRTVNQGPANPSETWSDIWHSLTSGKGWIYIAVIVPIVIIVVIGAVMLAKWNQGRSHPSAGRRTSPGSMAVISYA